ncbi:hypothetical protein NWP10_06800, partial [Micrococcus sp. HG099]|uniref:VOC family protein n=1 Tax=Micrococcus sp. HG099 TaxID=2969755 RepID=UPI00281143C2
RPVDFGAGSSGPITAQTSSEMTSRDMTLDSRIHVPEPFSNTPEAAGARRHPVQPAEDGSWVVFTDPAGHLFCLCQA